VIVGVDMLVRAKVGDDGDCRQSICFAFDEIGLRHMPSQRHAYTVLTMRRLSWLLWLLIALMPVRGIAQSLMVGGAFGHGSAATSPAAAEIPCPMHAIQGDAAAQDALAAVASGAHAAQGAQGTASSHVCSLCDVCHSAVLPLDLPLAQADGLHDAAPRPSLGLGAGRAAPADLFRPPR
jgi:hypothetical protein